MGEAKRRSQLREVIDKVVTQLSDEGRLVEAGWRAYQLTVLKDGAPDDQLREMRQAFFAGAQHLFGSMMSFLEEGQEATENDLKRMDLIHAELEAFVSQLAVKHYPVRGSA